jgi:hypothetical protein
MVPTWLHVLSLLSVALGVALALSVAADEVRRPQAMWIMNVVWPVTVLYGTGLWLYMRFGRAQRPTAKMAMAHPGHHHAEKPFAARVAISTAHCGSGRTLVT